MTTKQFIVSLESIIDNWSGNEIEPEQLIAAIQKSIPEESVHKFIKHYGDCCLECALNTYFEEADAYTRVDTGVPE